jgi:hypothetical protein
MYIVSGKAGFLLMKYLHQCRSANEWQGPNLPPGPAGPVPALGLSILPFLAIAAECLAALGTGRLEGPHHRDCCQYQLLLLLLFPEFFLEQDKVTDFTSFLDKG